MSQYPNADEKESENSAQAAIPISAATSQDSLSSNESPVESEEIEEVNNVSASLGISEVETNIHSGESEQLSLLHESTNAFLDHATATTEGANHLETLTASEEEVSLKYSTKVLRQGPWLHPYPTVVTLSLIALMISIVMGSFIVDRYYSKFFTPNYFSAPPDLENVIETVQKSTVVVTCGESLGSGWAIDLGPVVAEADFELKIKDKRFPYSVITNHHVIESCVDNPDAVRVSNGVTEFISSLFTYDEENDLAIVATRAQIPPLPFSQKPEPGWWSLALGSPFGLEKSVSTGNVMNTLPEGYIISSAPINPGNSGGPLINSLGEVMGTNTSYLRNSQSFNFASDIDLLCEKLVNCGGSSFERERPEQCSTWCGFKQWLVEIRDFVLG